MAGTCMYGPLLARENTNCLAAQNAAVLFLGSTPRPLSRVKPLGNTRNQGTRERVIDQVVDIRYNRGVCLRLVQRSPSLPLIPCPAAPSPYGV